MNKLELLKKELKYYKELATCDYLTGLFNRRQLEIDLERYLELQKRHKVKFMVLMLDINNFKAINDQKGHIIGDKILRNVANLLKYTIRKTDKAYRLAGDEFIIILTHTLKDHISKRIKQILKNINIKVSIGTAKLCPNILDIIDKKMYEDKRR